MNKQIVAAIAAIALTAVNVAASEAGSLRLKQKDGGVQPIAGQFKATGGGQQGGAGHSATDTFKAPFVPACVQGFQKFDVNSVGSGNNKKIQSFSCRTGWIECPDFPDYVHQALHVETEYQGDPDLGGRVRIVYTCEGWNPAG